MVKIPTGANKGTEPYDGYAMAEDYELKVKAKEEKAKKHKRIWTFSKRLLALCLFPMLVVCASVATLSTMTLKSSIEWEIQNSLQIVAARGQNALGPKCEPPPTVIERISINSK